MELTGTITKILDEKQVSEKFRKRELILTTDDNYPQTICVEFTQDKTGLLDTRREGEQVRISINIRGREWQSPSGEIKYFTSVQGWKIQPLEQQPAQGQDRPPPEPYNPGAGGDDIPFMRRDF